MEALSRIKGTELPEVSIPTYVHFVPQLLRNPSITNATPQTFRYGPLESQELDVYFPPEGVRPAGSSSKPPVFFFYYGGGFMSGRRQMDVSVGVIESLHAGKNPDFLSDPLSAHRLYHQNIGTFIANRGFVAVVPDYRLVNMALDYQFQEGDARWPSGSDDVLLSIKWAVNNLPDVADAEQIYALGHSAGANHLAMMLLLPQYLPRNPEIAQRLKRAVTLSATFDYIHSREERKTAWTRYYGTFDLIPARCPTGLVRALEDGGAKSLPPLLCLHAARDHFGAIDPQQRFWDGWTRKGGRGEMKQVPGKEHNHMSTIVGIGSGDAETEQWLVDALQWCLEIQDRPL